jgi:hypothetical protein
VSARPRTEIMRDLNTLMAELNAATQNERAQTERLDDVSPKLQQALGATQRHTRAFMPSTAEVPIKSHEEIRAAARAYKPADYKYESENPERLKDYTPAHDPDWPPDAVWMGTGDQKLVE